MADANALQGRRVLVVEDEVIVAMLLEDILSEAGATVVGPAARVDQALAAIAAQGIDAALLDMNLAGEGTAPVAEELRRRGIPFAFATGYGAAGLPDGFDGHPLLQKPFREGDVLTVLAHVLAGAAVSPAEGR